jgi:hypothetical protein
LCFPVFSAYFWLQKSPIAGEHEEANCAYETILFEITLQTKTPTSSRGNAPTQKTTQSTPKEPSVTNSLSFLEPLAVTKAFLNYKLATLWRMLLAEGQYALLSTEITYVFALSSNQNKNRKIALNPDFHFAVFSVTALQANTKKAPKELRNERQVKKIKNRLLDELFRQRSKLSHPHLQNCNDGCKLGADHNHYNLDLTLVNFTFFFV